MTVKIAHASIDENGRAKNGKAGDQTQREVCIRDWYSKPWQYVIRFKDPKKRELIAQAMEKAAKNDHIGYDQNQRNTALAQARSVGYDPGRITKDCETDCSALVALCCMYAGVDEKYLYQGGNSSTTRTLRSQLEKTGLVEVFSDYFHVHTSNNLIRGDILLKEGSHVAVTVQSGNTIIADQSVDEVARDVIKGKYGNMPERKKRIEAAGYNYESVRMAVMRIIHGG